MNKFVAINESKLAANSEANITKTHSKDQGHLKVKVKITQYKVKEINFLSIVCGIYMC